uniref:Uncharacterized protein n=1 Tax=Gopherus evgoodei TaxID=1825980 RepID=A0A8C4Y9D6_9SAUR
VLAQGLTGTLWQRRIARSHLPPGPTPLPFLGNVLQLKAEGMVNSLREVGLLFSNGERWRQLRRFSLAALQDFGTGQRSVEEQIQDEAQRLVEEFRKTKGLPFDPTFFLSRSASSVICAIVFGQRFDYADESFLDLLLLKLPHFNSFPYPTLQLYEMFSWIMRFLPGAHKQIFQDLEDINSFILERIKANQASLDRDNPRDFIDCFLLQMEKEILNPTTEFHLRNLVLTAFNLFFVGTETSHDGESWCLQPGHVLCPACLPLEKMTQEIDRVIGRSRMPAVEDRSRMPYTDAVIHEIQRFSDVIPMNLPHALTQDTHFRGYTIPKGTEVFPVLSSVLWDPSRFRDPERFDPTRFLDEQGQFKANEAFMPFSTGKRSCVGQELARMELFVFLTAILQNFTLKCPVPPQDLDLRLRGAGFAHVPPCYQLCAVPRGEGSRAQEERPKDRLQGTAGAAKGPNPAT